MRLLTYIVVMISLAALAGCTTGRSPDTGPAPDRPDMHTDFPFMGHHEQAGGDTGEHRDG